MPKKANAVPQTHPFDLLAAQYDAWFDSDHGRPIFKLEAACLADLMAPIGGSWLEVGVGTGRFAQALGAEEGVDPSLRMLELAAKRGIRTRRGRGEDLPYPDGSFDGVLMVATICFLSDPNSTMRECARVLKDAGHLVVGLVPSDSAWGRLYTRRGRGGHPFYSTARFYTCDEVIRMAESAGFAPVRAASCLFSAPGERLDALRREGIVAGAGFVAIHFRKSGPAVAHAA